MTECRKIHASRGFEGMLAWEDFAKFFHTEINKQLNARKRLQNYWSGQNVAPTERNIFEGPRVRHLYDLNLNGRRLFSE